MVVKLVTLVAIAFFVVRRGEDTTWKLRYTAIIAAPVVVGFAIALLIESLNGSSDDLPISIAIICGYIGLAIAATWSYWRSSGIYKGKRRGTNRSDKTVM
jgi:hypothetical protein